MKNCELVLSTSSMRTRRNFGFNESIAASRLGVVHARTALSEQLEDRALQTLINDACGVVHYDGLGPSFDRCGLSGGAGTS